MTAAILGAILYSYKIARSQVYPIGFAQKAGTPPTSGDSPIMHLREQISDEIVLAHISEEHILSEAFMKQASELDPWSDVVLIDYISETQSGGLEQARKLDRNSRVHYVEIKVGQNRAEILLKKLYEKESVHLDARARTQRRLFEVHRRMEEMEKRLRQLEVESVKKLQDLSDEKDGILPTIH
jgi:hypothetical protein